MLEGVIERLPKAKLRIPIEGSLNARARCIESPGDNSFDVYPAPN